MARIFIAATIEDVSYMERILGAGHELTTVGIMSEAQHKLKEESFDLVMIGVHFDQSRMFDLLRELHKARYDSTPVICFCTQETMLTRAAHESIAIASRALGAWMYLDYQKYKPKQSWIYDCRS